MTWPLPAPADIAERIAAGYETAFALVAGPAGVDARSPMSTLGQLARVQGMAAFDLHLAVQRLSEELLPDTARDELQRHADVWGVPRRPGAPAQGTVRFAGANGLALAAGLTLLAGDRRYTTLAGGVMAGGVLDVPARADATGAAGNVAAGASLALAAPVAGLSAQSATVQAPGLSGGQDEEELDAWRSRLLSRIRGGVPFGQGGSYADWALTVPGVALASERPGWVGRGTVGVVVAGGTRAAPTAPDAALLAAVQAELDARRPVTAQVFALAVELAPVAVSVRVQPDTAAVRAAVSAAFALFLQTEPGIGGTIARSRMSEAISAAAGEWSHRLDLPAADVALAPRQLAVPGAITWLAS